VVAAVWSGRSTVLDRKDPGDPKPRFREMSNPDAAIIAVCEKLQFILKTVWIVKIAALIFVSC
jgi:hypothetical protein